MAHNDKVLLEGNLRGFLGDSWKAGEREHHDSVGEHHSNVANEILEQLSLPNRDTQLGTVPDPGHERHDLFPKISPDPRRHCRLFYGGMHKPSDLFKIINYLFLIIINIICLQITY
jgi:hypothetical protein